MNKKEYLKKITDLSNRFDELTEDERVEMNDKELFELFKEYSCPHSKFIWDKIVEANTVDELTAIALYELEKVDKVKLRKGVFTCEHGKINNESALKFFKDGTYLGGISSNRDFSRWLTMPEGRERQREKAFILEMIKKCINKDWD